MHSVVRYRIICYSFLIDVKASNHVNGLLSFMIARKQSGSIQALKGAILLINLEYEY
jgi:hypothetical protein